LGRTEDVKHIAHILGFQNSFDEITSRQQHSYEGVEGTEGPFVDEECRELSKYGPQASRLPPAIISDIMTYLQPDMSTFGYTWDILGFNRTSSAPETL